MRRRELMRRRSVPRSALWRTGLVATFAVVLCVRTTSQAGALTTGTASSMPAFVGTGTLSANLELTGAVGGLINGLISPIVNGALNPLINTVQGTLSTVVASTLGVSSPLVAGNPSGPSLPAPGAFPGDLPAGLPAPCTTGTLPVPVPQPCFSATGPGSVSLPGLVTLTTGALRGYTQQVTGTNTILGRAQVADVSVAALPALPSLVSPLVNVSTIDSLATCPVGGGASANVATATVNLLGGLLSLKVLNGEISTITLGGGTYTLTALPTVTVGGFTLSAYGTALKLSIALSLANVLTALGLDSSIIGQLTNDALPNTSLTLSVIVGPNSQVTSTSAQAWGLGIGVDLSGSLGFTLLGLVGATVSVPSGIGGGNYGNLLDARLAYTSCTSSAATTTTIPVVPPALI